jgi:hypothetical protein
MPINQNHLFDELNGKKCAIVEKNASVERVAFLRSLLELNGYTVEVVVSPPPKPTTAPPPGDPSAPVVVGPETFTIGVTEVSFNPTNAIFGRLLKTHDGHVVTLAYWQQKDSQSHDDIPYFEGSDWGH